MTQTLFEFYDGKTLFITGAAGFAGTVLLEILLSSFPGIKRIYILLRSKRGTMPQDRKKIIFTKTIMSKLLKNNPNIDQKVYVVSGDVSLPNLGMSDEDMQKVCDEATIVFHCAGVISFTKAYSDISMKNSKGTYYVLELCRRLKTLDVLVYTSTAYSNCHIYPRIIEEKVYPLPYPVHRFLDELENGSKESFEDFVSSCNIPFTNSYTFSKCLAENILQELAADLPVAIVRPSMIFCTWKGSMPGFVQKGSGMVDLTLGVCKGLLRLLHTKDDHAILDIIPADIVANSHIVAGWAVAAGKCPSMFVVNSTAGDVQRLSYENYIDTIVKFTHIYPMPNAFQTCKCKLITNEYYYRFLTLYKHYFSAIIFDLYLRFTGSKIRLLKLYTYFDQIMKQTDFISSRTFHFETKNFKSLSKFLSLEERQIIPTDLGRYFNDVYKNLNSGSMYHDWKYVNTSKKKQMQEVYMRTMVIDTLKKIILLLFCYLIYVIFHKLFFQ